MATHDETEATGVGASSGDDPESGAMGLTGKVLAGRYRVQSRLGAGGMATVYRAKDESDLARAVVIKVPHRTLLVDPNFRKRFLGEVRSLSRLEHPNIIPIYDVGEDDGVPFAVTKFLAGGDLNARCERTGGTMTPEQVLEWLPKVAETLDYVYRKGQLHRDVSPGNVIFDGEGNPHLSDFGIATVLKGGDPDETAQDLANLTRPGGFVGAATYAPPESIKRELNPAYDQYSLAVVVYEALTGEVPFERGTSEAVLVAKNTQEPRPITDHRPEIPAGCASAVMRALSKDPAERFESSTAFAKAFEQGLRAPAAVPPDVAEPEPEPYEGTIAVDSPIVLPDGDGGGLPWAKLAAGLGVAVALAAGAFWYANRPEPPPGAPVLDEPVAHGDGAPAGRIEVTVGSTAAEQQAALELCRQVAGDGCSAEDYQDEVVRTETIPRVRVDPDEVTNRAFAAFASTTRHLTTAERQGYSYVPVAGGVLAKGTNLDWREPTRDAVYKDRLDHPVVHVSLADAQAYCEAQGKRLPTEAEWEHAARGDSRRVFPWGNDWSGDRAVWQTTSTSPVGSATAGSTAAGLRDMAGNVWEWTTTEVPDGSGQVFLKGGSWASSDPAQLRGAMHMMALPTDTSADVGFRCVEDLEPRRTASAEQEARSTT